MPSLLVMTATALLATLLFAASAQAIDKWPRSTVTFRDRSDWPAAVNLAVKWWNDAPGRLKLVRARPGQRAQVRIVSANLDSAGLAGLPPDGRVDLDRESFNAGEFRYQADVAAHEIGHALGLPHIKSQCALMYAEAETPADIPACNSTYPPGVVRCGPQRDDVRAMNRRYGGGVGETFYGFRCASPGPGLPVGPLPINFPNPAPAR